MKVHWLIAGLVLAASAGAEPAAAQVTSPRDVASEPLPLTLDLSGTRLDAQVIRRALEAELNRPLTLDASSGAQSLSVVAHSDQTVSVTYRSANGETRSRTIGVSADPARSAELIALLAANLARDEAAELLAGLTALKASPAAVDSGGTSNRESSASQTAETSEPARPAPPIVGVVPPPPSGPTPARLTLPIAPFDLSFLSPLALYPNAKQRAVRLELGLLYSHVGELQGVGVNALVLNCEGDVHGLSLASIYNRSFGRVRGLAVSGLIQSSGGFEGVQLSGALNLGTAGSTGFTAAGAVDLEQDFNGVQLAGAVNRAHVLAGVQISGGVNIAERVSGLQLAIVNVAREVDGLQLGVVNVAKHVNGTSIGLVSVADNGRIQPLLFTSTSSMLNAAMKFRIGALYSQAGFGASPTSRLWQYELGLGGHFELGRWFLEPGVHYSEERDTRHLLARELREYAHYRVAVGCDFGKVTAFAGGGLRHRLAQSVTAPATERVSGEAFFGVGFF